MAKKHKENNDKHHSPNYYIRKRLIRNKPALFGLTVIVLAAFVALSGYLIMPDQTPDANDGAVQVQKKLPGFSVVMLRHRKNMDIEKRGFFEKMLVGQESVFLIEPINSYRIEEWDLIIKPFGETGMEEKAYPLINVVKPLYTGTVEGEGFNGHPYQIENEIATYIDIHGEKHKITRAELIREFEKHNVQRRVFILGTDKSGRDIYSRILFGARISLSIGFVAVLISMVLGLTLGALAGFFGGRIDTLIMWFMSVAWSIPSIMLVIAISIALQSRGVWVAFVAVGLTMWVEVARVVRGQIMAIKQKLFIEAARAFGMSNYRIVFHHIMPNILGPLVVIGSSNFAAAILLEAGLSFLGLSVQPPTPSWGIMIFEGYNSIGSENSWHLVVFPGLVICLMILSFNLLGNGLRDAFDPQTASK
jgi:ABC-type dipeptide/oligopeptide/nickel transport system permease subunit